MLKVIGDKILFFYIAISVIWSAASSAVTYGTPPDQVVFNAIYQDNNFSFGTIEAIGQDSMGFIWIGAKDGLLRYDGIDFKSYMFSRNDTCSLSNNVIRDILIDSRGNLWVGTENGLNKYRAESDDFQRFMAGSSWVSGLTDNNLRKLIEDEEGNIWIASRGGGIVRFDPKTSSFIRLENLVKSGSELLTGNIRTLYLDSNATLWIGTVDKGVLYFDPGDMQLKSFPCGLPDGIHVNGTDIRAIAEDGKGCMWFGSNGQGLTCFDPEEQRFTYWSSGYTGEHYLSADIIWSMTLDSRGTLWVCTDGGGLNRLDAGKKSFYTYRSSIMDDKSISSDVVRTFFEDNAGNYWIGNFDAALNYVNAQRKKFYILRDIIPNEEKVNQNKITAVHRDKDNNLWIATDGDGLIVYNSDRSYYHNYTSARNDPGSLLNDKPMCIEEDQVGNLWIGHFGGGLSYYNRIRKQFRRYFSGTGQGALNGTMIWDLLLEGDTLWIASEKGLELLDIKSGRFSSMDFSETGQKFEHYGVWHLFRDSRKRLLIGSYNGLFVYDREQNLLQHFLPSMTDTTSLSDKWILTIFEDRDKQIWLGTNGGGLNLWEEPGKFTCYTMEEGLAGNVVDCILDDEQGNLWISTNQGISKFDPDSLHFTNYSAEDGLQGNRFRYNAACKAPDGMLYFGGNNGISYFYPAEIKPSTFIPPVVITDIELFNKPVRLADNKSQLSRNILFEDEIHLYPSQKMFTIQFAALNFAQTHKNRYKYKLENFEDEWNDVGLQHWATYTNLKPGKYLFRVIGSNQDDIWNTKGDSLRIIIHPPFYKTEWFIIILIFALLFFIYMFYKVRVINVQQLNAKLSKLVAERTRELEKRSAEIAEQRDIATEQRDQIRRQNEELEQHRTRLEELVEERTQDLMVAKERAEESDRLKTAFLENLSHEIRTPMNAIIGFINLLADKIDDKNSREYYLRIINESGRNMLGLIQDIIDFSRMQTGELQPEYTECRINDIIKDLVTSARMRASREKPNLNIIADLPGTEVVIYSDDKKLKTIFAKLLENSIKFTDKGHIKIGIHNQEEKWITFCVRDTGIGIKPEYIDRIFDRFFTVQEEDNHDQFRGSGLGLAFARVATELMGGTIWAESKEGEGSLFCFKLPFMQVTRQGKKKSTGDKKPYFWPGKSVLVAEDEESNYLLIEAILRDTGVKIVHCKDGVELLEAIDSGAKYDMVLLDLKMPRMGGINAMKIIRESDKDVPVIVQTAYDQTNHRQQCIEFGCNDFLVKPLRKKELLDTMEKYLG